MTADTLKEDDNFLKEMVADGTLALPDENRLGRLTALARLQLSMQAEIEDMEQRLAGRKEALRAVTDRDIPELMHEIGAREIVLIDGHKLKIAPFYNGKITDERAYDWLEEHGKGDIVKVNLTVACKLSNEELIKKVRTTLHEAGIEWDENQGVHPSTLRAFIKDQISSGEPIDRELFNVYTGWRATIK